MNVAIQIQPYNYPHVTWLSDKLYVTAKYIQYPVVT